MSISGTAEQRASAVWAVVDRLAVFQGGPAEFLQELLEAQCRIGGASGAAVLRRGAQNRAEVVAVHPRITRGTAPAWIGQAIEVVNGHQDGELGEIVRPVRDRESLYGQSPTSYMVLLPLRHGQGAVGFHVPTGDPIELEQRRGTLVLGLRLLDLYEARITLQQRQAELQKLASAVQVLSAVNEHGRFRPASMALCNEIADRWRCGRVSLGLLSGRYVKLRAMSHTERVNRKMKLVQSVESAMEESFDQDLEVLHPAPPTATFVARAAAELARDHNHANICSLPLRHEGQVKGVLTLEREGDEPFNTAELEFLRLTCDLCTPRMLELADHDRWIGARAATQTKRLAAGVIGPRHTWAKLTAVAVLAVLLVLIFGQGTYRVEAPFVVEAVQQQVIPAPYDGYLNAVAVEIGDTVAAGDVLAELDTAELRARLAELRAERVGYLKNADLARRDNKPVEVQIALARAAQAQAQIQWIEHQISQAQIRSPIAGVVVQGELKRRVGAPVEKGNVLFEVAPLDALRAVLHVSENQVHDIAAGAVGELASASHPSAHVAFEVERIDPMAQVVQDRNVFRARARLVDDKQWMRPGMEGLAKVDAGRRSYLWIWTHEAVDWVRLKLWI